MKKSLDSRMGLYKMIGSTLAAASFIAGFSTFAHADNDGRRGDSWRGDDRRIERGGDRQRGDGRNTERSNKSKERHERLAPRRRGDGGHYDRHDISIWRSGRWHHGRYNGHLGWWWVVGGLSYLYPQPIYPYPDIYLPPNVLTRPAPEYSGSTTEIAPSVASQSWYYCESLDSYYPYAPTCPEGWQTVPATPPTPTPTQDQ